MQPKGTSARAREPDAVQRACVVVAGDGIVALAAALALRGASGPQARIIMAANPPLPGSAPDGRAFAISASARQLLDALGVWQALEKCAQRIGEIVITDSRVEDGVRPTLLSFADEAERGEALAHMVEAQALQQALALQADAANIERIPQPITDIRPDNDATRLTLGGGLAIETPLLVAADGARSICRELAGIGWIGWNYAQLGLTTTVLHEREHHGRAYEHFLPGGPFAILPLKGRRSSIVWTEDKTQAKRLLSLGDADIVEELSRRFGHELGHLRLEAPLAAFPLSFGIARSFVARRLALVGDAAHVVHPVAGQGLNLGLRDVSALAEAVSGALRLGLDPGAPHGLSSYQRARRFDTIAMGATTDGLVKLFSNDRPALRALRGLGLGIVDRLPLAKRFLAAEAAGPRSRVDDEVGASGVRKEY
ncbi:MAG: FAD-dependent monooxygenase [Hyphomicrobiales bacterium]